MFRSYSTVFKLESVEYKYLRVVTDKLQKLLIFQSQEIGAITPNTFFGRKRKDEGQLNIVAIWQREEDRERTVREEEARQIAEAERIHQENIRKIREQAKKNLDSPPDPPSVRGSPGGRLRVVVLTLI